MLPIQGVYEVVVPVKDLARVESFYCDVICGPFASREGVVVCGLLGRVS